MITKLSIDFTDCNIRTSVYFDGNGTLTIGCNINNSDVDDMDVDEESVECNCGENQLSHHDYEGNVRSDLPERCRRTVNGPIGPAAEATGAPCTVAAISRLTFINNAVVNDDDETESESVINSSMQVEAEPQSEEAPPSNQQANNAHVQNMDIKKPRERRLIEHVKSWTEKIAAATNSHKAAKKRKIHINVLGQSRKVNVRLAAKGNQ